MDNIENKTIFFKFGRVEPFHSLIALGDRAESMLNLLRSDISDLFIELLSPYKVGDKPASRLLVLADESSAIVQLPAVFSDEDFITHNLFVLDIAGSPQPEKWPDAFSYLWVPPTQQYTTVKHLFQMVYHDSILIHSFVSFDFCAWRWLVKGQRRVVTHKIAVNDDLPQRLRQVPLSEVPHRRSLVIVATPHEMVEDENFWSMINTNLFERLDPYVYKWTIVGKAPPLQESYIALLEFIPLSISVDSTL